MIDSKLLDGIGLKRVWDKAKNLFIQKKSLGKTIVDNNGLIDVAIPIKETTKIKFDEMSDEEKKGLVVVMDENPPIEGINKVTATVSNTIGTPSVAVTTEDTDDGTNINFAFSGLKGKDGDKGDTVQSEEIYSTEESRIGTWIDGKPLYRIVINGNTGPSIDAAYAIASISSLNVDVVAKMTGMMHFWDNGHELYYPMIIGDIEYSQYIRVHVSKRNQCIYTYHSDFYANRDISIILEYTKTTD